MENDKVILNTNKEYHIVSTDEYFFISRIDNELIINSSDIPVDSWAYIVKNASDIEDCGLIAISDDPDYYPDGYLNINSYHELFIDNNDMLMIKDMWELDDCTVRDWINENSEDIEIFNQSVIIDSDMCESMGIFEDISNSLYEECLNNEHTDIVEFFDYDDDKVTDWFSEHLQTPVPVMITNTDARQIDPKYMDMTNKIIKAIYELGEKTEITYNELYDKIFSIISQ